jgi:hypothetical protein
MMPVQAINLFGGGVALVGLGGLAAAGQAYREALAIPRCSGGSSLIGAMIFILLVDVFVVMMGVWIALTDVTFMGGSHG